MTGIMVMTTEKEFVSWVELLKDDPRFFVWHPKKDTSLWADSHLLLPAIEQWYLKQKINDQDEE